MTSCEDVGSETVADAVPFEDINNALPPDAVESEYLLPELVGLRVNDSPSRTTSPLLVVVAVASGLVAVANGWVVTACCLFVRNLNKDAAGAAVAAAGAGPAVGAAADTAESGVVGTVSELRCVESGFVDASVNTGSAIGVCVGPVGVVACVLAGVTGVTVREGALAAGAVDLVDSAVADWMADLEPTDDRRRDVRAPLVESEADDRVAEAVEELPAELSAAAVAAVMTPTAVPIPSSTANTPTRPTFTA